MGQSGQSEERYYQAYAQSNLTPSSQDFVPSPAGFKNGFNSSPESNQSIYSSGSSAYASRPEHINAEVSPFDCKPKTFNNPLPAHDAKVGFVNLEENQMSRDQANFEFPDGGWECGKCQNYNFKGRKACYRCKKAKSGDDIEGKPEHMNLVTGKMKKQKKTGSTSEAEAYEYGLDNRVNKFRGSQTRERAGDWTCQRCNNHNFSFREVCNMCDLNLTESNKMLLQPQPQQVSQDLSLTN
jgi:hypothetical protein